MQSVCKSIAESMAQNRINTTHDITRGFLPLRRICYLASRTSLPIYPLNLIFKLLPFLRFCTSPASTMLYISRDNNPLTVGQCNCYKKIYLLLQAHRFIFNHFSFFARRRLQRGLLLQFFCFSSLRKTRTTGYSRGTSR